MKWNRATKQGDSLCLPREHRLEPRAKTSSGRLRRDRRRGGHLRGRRKRQILCSRCESDAGTESANDSGSASELTGTSSRKSSSRMCSIGSVGDATGSALVVTTQSSRNVTGSTGVVRSQCASVPLTYSRTTWRRRAEDATARTCDDIIAANPPHNNKAQRRHINESIKSSLEMFVSACAGFPLSLSPLKANLHRSLKQLSVGLRSRSETSYHQERRLS